MRVSNSSGGVRAKREGQEERTRLRDLWSEMEQKGGSLDGRQRAAGSVEEAAVG